MAADVVQQRACAQPDKGLAQARGWTTSAATSTRYPSYGGWSCAYRTRGKIKNRHVLMCVCVCVCMCERACVCNMVTCSVLQ